MEFTLPSPLQLHPMTERKAFGKLVSFIKRKTSQKYKFDLQYENKQWDGLKGLQELAHYSVIVGYTKHFCKNCRILDLGCGEGALLEKFSNTDYSHYLAIDFSEVAIQNVKHLETDKIQFRVGDLNSLAVGGEFDVIIYNESLYYLSNPQNAIKALFKHLRPGGIFIISMVDKHGQEREGVWKKVNEVLELQDKTKVSNRDGASWTIGVFKMREN